MDAPCSPPSPLPMRAFSSQVEGFHGDYLEMGFEDTWAMRRIGHNDVAFTLRRTCSDRRPLPHRRDFPCTQVSSDPNPTNTGCGVFIGQRVTREQLQQPAHLNKRCGRRGVLFGEQSRLYRELNPPPVPDCCAFDPRGGPSSNRRWAWRPARG